MAELLQLPAYPAGSAHGQGNRTREASALPALGSPLSRREEEMLDPQIRSVVGIDIAKLAHVYCVLEVASGRVQGRPRTIPATQSGYQELLVALQGCGAPATVLIGLEATGCLWEPLYEVLTQAGYGVLVLNPRQTAAWATALGLRAKTDRIDAQTLARGLLAGYGRGSTLPSETVQALRALTRARRDLVQTQTAAKQRVRDELVVRFPELPTQTPAGCDLFAPSMLRLLQRYPSAAALAQVALPTLAAAMATLSENRWTVAQAQALQTLAQHSAAGIRALAARSIVVQTMTQHLLDLQQRLAELEGAIETVLAEDDQSRTLQRLVGIGPVQAATFRAEVGDIQRFAHVDQVVAYAGLDRRVHRSGSFVGQTHLSKRGPGALRHMLYLAVLAVIRCRPTWQARYQRLLDRGRAKKEALTILSRALLKVIYHFLRSGTLSDPALLRGAAAGVG
jgi:transposase